MHAKESGHFASARRLDWSSLSEQPVSVVKAAATETGPMAFLSSRRRGGTY